MLDRNQLVDGRRLENYRSCYLNEMLAVRTSESTACVPVSKKLLWYLSVMKFPALTHLNLGRVEPAQHRIEHEAIDDARDVVIFEDFGNGRTKLTMIGNETMEDAKNSGQLEGWNETLEKVAEVVAALAQAK